MKNRLLILTVGLLVTYSAFSQSLLGAAYLANTLELGYKQKTFSGFAYSENKTHYIVTARHAFDTTIVQIIHKNRKTLVRRRDSSSLPNGANVVLFYRYSQSWNRISGKVYFHKDRNVDIALIEVDNTLPVTELPLGDNGLQLTSECFVTGYPLGIRMENLILGDSLTTFAIAKRGNIAGMGRTDGKYLYFVLDITATKGFSGGPVLIYNSQQNQWTVAAIMGGYFAQNDEGYDSNGRKTTTTENSGIAYAYEVKFIHEIIGFSTESKK